MFQTYASYSRSITWALIQILQEYYRANDLTAPEMEFAIYQNDLKLESDMTQVQMYFSEGSWLNDSSARWNCSDTVLVMVVPISSSLTTFSKMLLELNRMFDISEGENFSKVINYTAFLVRDDFTKKNNLASNYVKNTAARFGLDINNPLTREMIPTQEEAPFLMKVIPDRKLVLVSGINNTIREVYYLSRVVSDWENPLVCSKCFPKDVLMEYPLVETDPTSTVPTQQFYRNGGDLNQEVAPKDDTENDRRMCALRTHVVYGHVSRGANHYQYYVRTREYFQHERTNITKWLDALKKREFSTSGRKTINVLVIPQQTSNVEFSQYVYEYYFNSEAECVIINTEKEFRSNLLAEYNGLFSRLKSEQRQGNMVHFHYVDTSIRSGSSFSRIVSLLSSCMETEQNNKSEYFRFHKVFLLLSRLSESSKYAYVDDPANNFHAYLEIHISAMRTFGDSCVPCKLQQDALNFFKKSATKPISAYWERKAHQRRCVPFDSAGVNRSTDADEGFIRMMCAHRANHYIDPIRGNNTNSYFNAIRAFFTEIIDAFDGLPTVSPIYRDVPVDGLKPWLSAALKIIARPFFSYDYKLRCAVMDLYLVMSELFLCDDSDPVGTITGRLEKEGQKTYLLENGNVAWAGNFLDRLEKAVTASGMDLLEFMRSHVFKGLTDMRSNYILRRSTIIETTKRLSEKKEECYKDFFNHYVRSILRLTHSSSDEIKSLWLEHLLQNGTEIQSDSEAGKLDASQRDGISVLSENVPESVKKYFQDFLEQLLIENNRPLYQRIRQIARFNSAEDNVSSQYNSRNNSREYNERNADRFLSYGLSASDDRDSCIQALVDLYCFLVNSTENIKNSGNPTIEKGDINHSYPELQKHLQKIVNTVNKKCSKGVILMGKREQPHTRLEHYLNMTAHYGIVPTDAQPQAQMALKNASKAITSLNDLSYYGYGLTENQDGTFNVVLALDNNYNDAGDLPELQSQLQKISPKYIYLPCALDRRHSLMLIRMILMFRTKLIALIEFDIFALLIMNPRRVLTYDMIIDLVWHENLDYYSHRAISNHVSNLRRKLRIAPEIPDYIRSVHGIGYKFNPDIKFP